MPSGAASLIPLASSSAWVTSTDGWDGRRMRSGQSRCSHETDGSAGRDGRANHFSGASGTLLHSLVSPNAEVTSFFGKAVAGVDDVDGDGRGDLLVGAFEETVLGQQNAGRAYLFSGATGALLATLLAAVGRPLAAPSANASGRISPTRFEHVLASLGGRIPLIVDAGPTAHGLESTIVALTGGAPRLLRPGPIDLGLAAAGEERVEAPGQLASHYAPAKPLRLEAESAEPDEWLIGFGPVEGDDNLSPAGDSVEAAARLFDALHRAEASGRAAIAVAPIPEVGLGMAINDRLRRAAAPRPLPA